MSRLALALLLLPLGCAWGDAMRCGEKPYLPIINNLSCLFKDYQCVCDEVGRCVWELRC